MALESEAGSGEETEGISPSSCLYWERDESGVERAGGGVGRGGVRGISACSVLLKHGDQMLPKLSNAVSLCIIN